MKTVDGVTQVECDSAADQVHHENYCPDNKSDVHPFPPKKEKGRKDVGIKLVQTRGITLLLLQP